MPSGQIVSPQPIGASRNYDVNSHPQQGDPMSVAGSRGGGTVGTALIIGSTNRGFSGGTTSAPNMGAYQAAQQGYIGRAARWAGGSHLVGPYIDLFTQRPATRFAWPIGRYYLECVLWWDKIATNVLQDSGIMLSLDWSNNFFPRMRGAGEQGIEVGIVPGGTLSLITRGAGGTEDVSLAAYHGSLLSPTKIRIQIRQATFERDAQLEVYVNDALAAARSWAAGHKLPVPYTAVGATAAAGNAPGGSRWQIVSADLEANQQLFVSQLHIVAGPDVPNL